MAKSPLALPPLVLGGAGFSYQINSDPESIPIHSIIRQAFDKGLRAIDTAPYYEPSETLLGKALSHTEVTEKYKRSDFILMTKIGRMGPEQYDYTTSGVRQCLERSLQRLQTTYLDVVFCHDIEAVTDQDVLDAVGVLLEFVQQGKVKHIGLSSYRIDILAKRANMVREQYGSPIDVIQVWGQLTLQSARLETEGLAAFRDAGVSSVCSSSPLAIGLLRQGGVPTGKRGDWHPAPEGLRKASQDAADDIETQGDTLAALALRYSLWRAWENSSSSMRISVLTGISSLFELDENVKAAQKLLGSLEDPGLNRTRVEQDQVLYSRVHAILKDWQGWQFTSPPKGWSQELKRMVTDDDAAKNT